MALSCSSVCASPSVSTSLIANEAPERPSSSASAWPMPEPAPVTAATFPANPSMGAPCYSDRGPGQPVPPVSLARGSLWRRAQEKVGARTPVGGRATVVVQGLGPAAADGGVGGRHVVACRLDFLAVAVGLFVDDLEVAAQLGDEFLAGHRTRAAPEVAGGQTIAHDGLVLGLQGGGLGADQRAVGIHVAELVTDRHECSPKWFRWSTSWTGSAGRPALGSRSCWRRGSDRHAHRAAC